MDFRINQRTKAAPAPAAIPAIPKGIQGMEANKSMIVVVGLLVPVPVRPMFVVERRSVRFNVTVVSRMTFTVIGGGQPVGVQTIGVIIGGGE